MPSSEHIDEMLPTPAVVRTPVALFDTLLYGGSNWFFLSYAIEFSPWLVGAAAAYNLLSFYGYKYFLDFSMEKRAESHEDYANSDNPNPQLLLRNERLLGADAIFHERAEAARLKRELNDLATTAMACVMVGNPVVTLMCTAIVGINFFYNFSKPSSDPKLTQYGSIALYLGAFFMALTPSLMPFATFAIAVLKIINYLEYYHDSGAAAYGKADQENFAAAKHKGENIGGHYNLRIGKVDTIKFFNLELEPRDRGNFENAFLFNSHDNVYHYPEVSVPGNPCQFPANIPADNFPAYVSEDIINTLNRAVERIFLHHPDNPLEFVSTEMRCQALRNIVNTQRAQLAEDLASTGAAADQQLDRFTEICEKRIEQLEEFCCHYLENIDETSYYNHLLLSMKHPSEIQEALESGKLDPSAPSVKQMQHVQLPVYMTQGPSHLSEYGYDPYDIHYTIDKVLEIADVFEILHHWPALEQWPIPKSVFNFAVWLSGAGRPHIQFSEHNDKVKITLPGTPLLVSEHVLKSIAAHYIATCKAFGKTKHTVEVNSDRLRHWIKRYGKAYGVSVNCHGESKMIAKYTKPSGTALHAQALDLQLEEVNNPRAYEHDDSECERYNRLVQEAINVVQPSAPPLVDANQPGIVFL